MRVLLLDNYDSFTYNLYDYVERLGMECRVVRNDDPILETLTASSFDALLLSPGPQRPEQAGQLLPFLERFKTIKPILGVCLGHQAIALTFGAELVLAPEPVHGKVAMIRHEAVDLFEGLPNPMEVMRYHSIVAKPWETKALPLRVTARTSDNLIMALAHETYPIYGVQFHPESILSHQGLALIENWKRASLRHLE